MLCLDLTQQVRERRRFAERVEPWIPGHRWKTEIPAGDDAFEAFRDIEYDDSNCLIAARACEQVISLPAFAQMTDEDIQYVAWAIRQTISELRS